METNEAIEINDLTLTEDQQAGVKGGGDINGDGRDDIITGAEANGHVKVFSKPGVGVLRNVDGGKTWTI